MVYLRDGNNCELLVLIVIIELDFVLIDLVVINNVLCNGMVIGIVMIYVSGGVGGYIYLWLNN